HIANTVGIIHMVENNDIDIGIVEGPVSSRNLVTRVCWVDELVAVAAPGQPLAKKDKVDIAEVFRYPFISREEGSGTGEVIENYMAANKIEPGQVNSILEFGGPESIKNAVAVGLGVSIL